MRLSLLLLDDRIVPAAVWSSNGEVWVSQLNTDGVRDFTSFVPFDDFQAAHFTSASGNVVVVGSAEGGGPRVQIRNGGNVTADFFAYEPSFRSGVHVGVSGNRVVTGAGDGGGPVVAVYDTTGQEISRFYAYDPDFRGGVRVAISGDRIFTAPGLGGGPHVREFDSHGTLIDEWLVGDVDRRTGFEPLLGDFDHDQVMDVGLWDGHVFEFRGHNSIIEQQLAGIDTASSPWIGSGAVWGEAGEISVGYPETYDRHDAAWVGLNHLIPFVPEDLASGNPSPPKTTGIRPGNRDPQDNAISGFYRDFAKTVSLSGTQVITEAETLGDRTVRPVPAGTSVGSLIGTGTSLGTFESPDGSRFLVTARHVLYRNPYGGDPFPVEQPGRADGGDGQTVTDPPYQSPAIALPPQTYSVDAVAVPITDSDPALELFRGVGTIERPTVTGTIDDPDRGDLLIAIGRGNLVGIGYLIGRQQQPITVNWSGNLANQPKIADQWLAVGLGIGDLSYPGFSGGPVYRVTSSGLELLGMTVAGGGGISIITPIASIEQSLGMKVITN